MSNRSYGQFCGLALALDRIGDRWTLLIVRELMAGPARFGELHQGLPGIATNLLTGRLRDLEEEGLVVRRAQDPPVYALTEIGEGLAPALRQLMLWGASFMPETDFCLPPNPRSWVSGLAALTSEVSIDGLVASVLVTLDGHDLAVVADGESVRFELGAPATVDATIVMDHSVMIMMARHELDPRTAIDHEDVSVAGDPAAAQVFFELLGRVRDGLAAPSTVG